jgi:hypothetical protein
MNEPGYSRSASADSGQVGLADADHGECQGRRYAREVDLAPGGWETWSWDESLFAGAASYYEQGRTPYAPGLADAFARSLALERHLDTRTG